MLQDSGVQSVVLCLDNDKAGKEASERIKGIVVESKQLIVVRQASLPVGIKDPDQMIREKMVSGFREVIGEAKVVDLGRDAKKLRSNAIAIPKGSERLLEVEVEKQPIIALFSCSTVAYS